MLRACRRALKPGGRIAFYTIFVAPRLSAADRRRVLALNDPPEVASRAGHSELLRTAGFVDVEETDETEHFLCTARGWYEARERHAAELLRLEGEMEFEEGQARRRAKLKVIEAGLLRRALFVAKRPG